MKWRQALAREGGLFRLIVFWSPNRQPLLHSENSLSQFGIHAGHIIHHLQDEFVCREQVVLGINFGHTWPQTSQRGV
jgi:hypothetical protein